MGKIFVVDTCALISYFGQIFGVPSSISYKSLKIIDSAFSSDEIKLIIPSAVFIEIFKKWFKDDETREKIKAEVYLRIKGSKNMEIQPFDQEILHNFSLIVDIEKDFNFDNHDKQVFASAMTMQCPLITSDERLIRYNKRKRLIPSILN